MTLSPSKKMEPFCAKRIETASGACPFCASRWVGVGDRIVRPWDPAKATVGSPQPKTIAGVATPWLAIPGLV